MEFGTVADWVMVGFSIAAFATALWANRTSDKAKDEAATANKIAGKSLEEAKRANQLTDEANSLTRATIEYERHPDTVEWVCQWDIDNRRLEIRNVGESEAKQVSVTIWDGHGRKITHVEDLNWDTPQWDPQYIGFAGIPPMEQLIEEGQRPEVDSNGDEITFMSGDKLMDGLAHYVLHARISWTDRFGYLHSFRTESPEINQ